MTYLNANDLPEHARTAMESAVINGCTYNVTTNYGSAVILSKDEYDALQANASGDYYCSSNGNYRNYGVEKELEGLFREEIDF